MSAWLPTKSLFQKNKIVLNVLNVMILMVGNSSQMALCLTSKLARGEDSKMVNRGRKQKACFLK
jgi:hypothetical protein